MGHVRADGVAKSSRRMLQYPAPSAIRRGNQRFNETIVIPGVSRACGQFTQPMKGGSGSVHRSFRRSPLTMRYSTYGRFVNSKERAAGLRVGCDSKSMMPFPKAAPKRHMENRAQQHKRRILSFIMEISLILFSNRVYPYVRPR